MIYGSVLEQTGWGLLALVIGLLIAGYAPPFMGRVTSLLNTRFILVLIFLVTCLCYGLLWGGLNVSPVIHDESSYILQAQTFAQGRWSWPRPPLAHFFEQFHVFVDPVRASKYPPGHALLLVPGVWLGCLGLVPLLLSGMTGSLLFALVRRVIHPWPALLAWFLWLASPSGFEFRASYYSEMTTGFLMLVAWWQLLNWHESSERKSLLIVAAAVGWSVITRPLAALAFTIPIGIYVLWRCYRKRLWTQLPPALALGSAILMVMAWQSYEITGDWTVTAYRQYSTVYFPFDVLGFDAQDTLPLRRLPLDFSGFRGLFLPLHEAHTVAALPEILLDRVVAILQTTWGNFWPVLGGLALFASGRTRKETLFALITMVSLVLAYLFFAHPIWWVIYYLEAQQILCMLTALGAWNAIHGIVVFFRRGKASLPTEQAGRVGIVFCALMVAILPTALAHAAQVHHEHIDRRTHQAKFHEQVSGLEGKSVVFVRYSPKHSAHRSLISNGPDLPQATAWIVYDRGVENAELMLYARGRRPYIFDETSGKLYPMDPATGRIAR